MKKLERLWQQRAASVLWGQLALTQQRTEQGPPHGACVPPANPGDVSSSSSGPCTACYVQCHTPLPSTEHVTGRDRSAGGAHTPSRGPQGPCEAWDMPSVFLVNLVHTNVAPGQHTSFLTDMLSDPIHTCKWSIRCPACSRSHSGSYDSRGRCRHTGRRSGQALWAPPPAALTSKSKLVLSWESPSGESSQTPGSHFAAS